MKASTWNRLWQVLIVEFAAAGIAAALSGGSLSAALITALPTFLASAITTVITADDYYQLNSFGDSTVKTLPADNYKVIIINQTPGNDVQIDITHEYQTYETQIRYRYETRTRIVTEYRTEEKTKIEYDTIQKPILVLPDLNGINWTKISIIIVFLGIVLLALSVSFFK